MSKEFKEWLDDYDPKQWEHDLLDSGKREPDELIHREDEEEPDQEGPSAEKLPAPGTRDKLDKAYEDAKANPKPSRNRSRMTKEEWLGDSHKEDAVPEPDEQINQELIEYNGVEDLDPDLLDIANLVYPCKTCGKVAHLGCVPSKFDPDKHFCTSCCP